MCTDVVRVYVWVVSPPLKIQNYNWPRKLVTWEVERMMNKAENSWCKPLNFFSLCFFLATSWVVNPISEAFTFGWLIWLYVIFLCVFIKVKWSWEGISLELSTGVLEVSPYNDERCAFCLFNELWQQEDISGQLSIISEAAMLLMGLDQDGAITHHNGAGVPERISRRNHEHHPPPPPPTPPTNTHTHTHVV